MNVYDQAVWDDHYKANPLKGVPTDGPKGTKSMNLYSAVNNALFCAMEADPKSYVFGEDVGFGGVFRCTQGDTLPVNQWDHGWLQRVRRREHLAWVSQELLSFD
ncbi:hypothetical protein CYMTET_20037 [Cymbomonas tetramitiformis]|uniref:Uncharacterized protein n=1 Tax=Cymbomonas tetramitiformis TaxID=36881 RepID=A0AAE0G5F3_9CHLO|nr:hypothetical protein CYMTET_20037 [Cymbomonas tetramitiformis]